MEHMMNVFAFATGLINATDVGILPMIVNFTFFVAYISMGAAFVFFLAQRNNVAPEYKTALTLSALIVGVAAFHYFYMKTLYAETTLPLLAEDAARNGVNYLEIIRKSFFGIINYRYMDWLITTPLLVAKIPLAVAAGRKVGKVITALIVADVFMIVTGFIGEQYVANPSAHLLWGAISTIGYLGIAYVIFTAVRNMAKDAEPEEQWAYKVMAIFIVTGWGIYPIGYMIPALFPQFDLNIVHIVYNIGDQINKIAPGIVVYMAGRQLLERRSPTRQVVGAEPLPAA
jgi:sensory rhodopsin